MSHKSTHTLPNKFQNKTCFLFLRYYNYAGRKILYVCVHLLFNSVETYVDIDFVTVWSTNDLPLPCVLTEGKGKET